MNQKGLTLIELLFVILFILVFATMGFLGLMQRERRIRLSGEAGELVSDLRFAKRMSISEQINYGVEFDFSTDSYRVIRHGDEREEMKRKDFPPGITIEGSDEFSEVKFTLFGAAFGRTEIFIQGEEFSKIIIVKPSGFIDVQRNNVN